MLKKELREEIFGEEIFFEFILQFALVITCLGGQFRINCPKAFLKISKFSKFTRVIYLKNLPKKTFGYWLITPNLKALRI